jgi:DNA polymerase I-like protein with 3'-5' exonuclease and polymerase domains
MRKDALGLLWEETKRPQIERVREIPPIPATGWKPPVAFPNLAPARTLSFDLETWDPELADFKDPFGETISGKGPGWARGKGHVIGLAVGTEDGGRWYFPLRHEMEPEWNCNPSAVFAWARHEFSRSHQPKVGANLLYDLGWLRQEGINVAGRLIDVQFAEALLDETARTALEVLGVKYLKEGKDSARLYEWIAAAYGGPATGEARKFLYKTPARLVGPYAESDVDLPLRVWEKQESLLRAEGLLDLFNMECALLPLLLEMRFAGVSVDLPKAEALREVLQRREYEEQAALNHLCGYQVNVNAAESLAPALDRLGIRYPLTEKTRKPSITKPFLESLAGIEIADRVGEIRKISKLRGTFLESYILGSHVNGKIFCQFHPMRADEGGTRSGRFSSSTPNLQNIPSRDEELAPQMRGMFIPDAGHRRWVKFDYSQIEYRFLAHFATGPGADDLRAQYNRDPRTDYHVHTQDMVQRILRREISRKPIKTINFGLIYGMGIPKLLSSLNLSETEGEEFFEAYHSAAPYAKATMESCTEEARNYGTISTILGRRSRFDLWEPDAWNDGERSPALPYWQASQAYGGDIRRAMLHKALNRKLQGSAADMMKLAMLECWKSGVFAVTGVPRLTVHDELDFSDPGGREAEAGFREIKRIMENCMKLLIPVIADAEAGPDWGHVSDVVF